MERRKLTEAEIAENLCKLNGWSIEEGKLVRKFKFADFAASLAFINKAGEIAERLDHHPDITFGWGYADIYTITHDRGGITDLDFALAKEIDAIG